MSWEAAPLGEASSSASAPAVATTKGKPVVVRVKRKASQSPLDAFWLEINGRPTKKPLFDFANLSVSDDPLVGNVVEKWGTKKLLVQHFETVKDSGEAAGLLHLFLQDSGGQELNWKLNKDRSSFRHDNYKQSQLRSSARKEHEDLVRNARYEQIWKSRRGNMETEEDSLHDLCHLYDVILVDSDDKYSKADSDPEVARRGDSALLFDFLPLLREYIPEAAVDIESDITEFKEGYPLENVVYDLYTVNPDSSLKMEDLTEYPLVQVDDDEQYYDGPLKPEYESDDSNAEDNPRNDYPEEESSEDEGNEGYDLFDDIESSDSEHEAEDEDEDDVAKEDEQDWRWNYR